MNGFFIVKWDPIRVSLDMEMMTSNGSYVFHHDECLTPSQIKSYFSRLSVKQRSKQQVFSSQTQTSTASSSSSSMSTINTNNTKSNGITIMDEPDDDESV